MTAKKVYFGMIGLIALTVLGIAGIIYLGNRSLLSQSNKLVEQKTTNKVLENQEIALAKAKQNVQKYKNLEEITQSIVPRDKDQARAVREITTLAGESGITIKSITFPVSNLGNKVQQPANGDKTSDTKDKNQPEEPKPDPISQAVPVKGLKGVYSLEANIIPSGTVNYYQFISFLAKLEKNRRTAQVTSIKIDPKTSSKQNPQLSFTLTLNIFLKP